MTHPTIVELRQSVAAPANEVWDAVVDWLSQGEWMLGTSVQVTEGDGHSVGSRLSAYTGPKPAFLAGVRYSLRRFAAHCESRDGG